MLKTNRQTIKIVGRVTYGNALGQQLGFPTANLAPTSELSSVEGGVWAAIATVEGQQYKAVVNIGHSPSVVERGELRVEAHIIDFSGDLYNKEIALTLCHHLRAERKFPTREALVEQIRKDKQQASDILDINNL